MAIKGGYKLIDLKDSKFTVDGDDITIKGIYNSIENSYNKPLILTGINIGGIEKNDVFVDFAVVSGSYVANISATEKITITNADLVTITAIG
jgi:hypothetical protein